MAEEAALLDLIDARDVRASMWVQDADTEGLSPDQKRAVENVAKSPWLVQPVSAPAGAGKTTSMCALAAVAHRRRGQVLVLAPTGKAVDVAVREGAGDTGCAIAKALHDLRDGGPAPVRRAIHWYRTHDRLHAGDQIAMATDAVAAYRSDCNASKEALLLCDTTEMADALNRRIHHDTIDPKAPTVGVAGEQRVAVGDLIISRRNDPTIPILDATRNEPSADPVRNGNRWRVYAIDTRRNRIAARRLDDDARAVFTDEYLYKHITYG